jgi:hypothetical protein
LIANTGDGHRDTCNRVIFLIAMKTVVSFGGRVTPGSGPAKYLNGETTLSKSRSTWAGIGAAAYRERTVASRRGYTDVMRAISSA